MGSRHDRSAHIEALMWNLRIDSATGEVVRALAARGIESIVLKGATFVEWYPADSARTYVDGDVWVSPGDVDRAEDTLSELGFIADADELGLPRWWVDHSSGWSRTGDGAKIDLHRKLQGTELEPQRAWDILWSQTVEFELGGEVVRRLPEAARALYAVLHSGGHGAADLASLRHMGAALSAVDDATWTQALALADQLHATDAFAVGVRLMPEGVALAERIGIPRSRSATSTLLASTPPSVAMGLEEFSEARGAERLRVLLRKLFPPAGFVRLWWSPAAANPIMLLVGYLYRWVWLIRRAPAGYRAWREAKRSVKSSS